ncbi:MAG: cytochrome c oxidase assembly protein [Actinomycetota bacterium]
MRSRIAFFAVGALVLGLVALSISLSVAGGAYEAPQTGLPDPGPVVGWGLPIVRFLTDLAGILTAGWLIGAAFLDPHGKGGVVSPTGRADLMRAVTAAGIWAVLALLQMFLLLAQVLGVTLDRAMTPDVAATYAWEIPNTRALAIVAVIAVIIAVGCLFTATLGLSALWTLLAVVAMALPALAGHGAGLGDHVLALSAGVTHGAAATVWIGGLIVLAFHGLRRDAGYEDPGALAVAARRFGVTALVCVILLAASGAANAYTRLDTPDQLLTTGYGQVTLAKIILLVILVGVAAVIRRRLIPRLSTDVRARAFLRVLGVEVSLLVVSIALGVTLAISPYPRIESLLPTYGESLLGFPYPPAPTAANVILGFRLEPVFLVGMLTLAGLYIAGVISLYSRGDKWPWGRTISWLIGVSLVIWTTNAGIAVYSQVSIGLHMVQHMTMSMLAPMFLVLGGPFTLALRALPPSTNGRWGAREWIVWGLHSTIAKVVTNPIFVFVVFSMSLFALYFTPLLPWLMGSHIGHLSMQLHFILAGYLFAWIVMGVDPVPKPLPYWAKFGLILLMVGVHAFFAIVIMMGTQPVAEEWYGIVRPDWASDPLQDTKFGGQIAWGISEIPMLFMILTVAWQWMRSEERAARRHDRQADRDGNAELNSYNDYLASLDRRAKSGGDGT